MIASSSMDAMCELTDRPIYRFLVAPQSRVSLLLSLLYTLGGYGVLRYHGGCVFLVFDPKLDRLSGIQMDKEKGIMTLMSDNE